MTIQKIKQSLQNTKAQINTQQSVDKQHSIADAVSRLQVIGQLLGQKKEKSKNEVHDNILSKQKQIKSQHQIKNNPTKEVPVKANEVFQSTEAAKQFIQHILSFHQDQNGKGFMSTVKSAIDKLKDFVNGKTAFKPSQLATLVASALGIVSGIATLNPALIGVSAASISMVSSLASVSARVLQTTGRGKISKPNLQVIKWQKSNPTEAKQIFNALKSNQMTGDGLIDKIKKALKILGIAVTAGSVAYTAWLQNQPQEISYPDIDHTLMTYDIEGEGQQMPKMPKSAASFLKKNPEIAKLIIKQIKSKKDMTGSGIMSKLKTILSVVGAIGIVGAFAFAKWYFDFYSNASYDTRRIIDESLRRIQIQAVRDASLTVAEILSNVNDLLSSEPTIKKKGKGIKLAGYQSKGKGLALAGAGCDKKSSSCNSCVGEGIKLAGYHSKGKGLALAGAGCDKESSSCNSCAGKGKRKQKYVGSKKEVWLGLAHHTSGRLTKSDLIKNKRGKIVSKKKHALGKKVAHNLIPKTK